MKHVHLIGIGGSGLSAIARLLKERGYTVSGSDRSLSPLAQQLAQSGVQVFVGHAAGNIAGAEIVVRSSAIQDDNPEVQAALAAGIPVLKRADFLGELMANLTGIAVAGTHGKTTTTAMIAWVLHRLGQDPSYIIGGVSKNLAANAHSGRGSTFVIEADEYDYMFLGLQPRLAVVTNLEWDHPDCFPTELDYLQAFQRFAHRLRPGGVLLLCADDEGAMSLASVHSHNTAVLTFGLHPAAIYRAEDLQINESGGFSFKAILQPEPRAHLELGDIHLTVPGLHNVRNALAALAVVDQLGISLIAAAGALAEYSGTGRRFDVAGEVNGITLVDDYAHHPTAIRTTLAAARSRFPERRIWAVWQPHTYSRTRSLADEFAAAFHDADRVLVTEIYASREAAQEYSAAEVVEHMQHPSAEYAGSLEATANQLLTELLPGDVVIVLSAGDADQINPHLLQTLQKGATRA
jgi:UDP-N-acetylmuramate--alanine ligase